jgi:hypothetical protein
MSKKTVLSAIVAAAGLATSAMAQSPVYQLEFVVDGTPGSPFQSGPNFYPQASASNPIPSAVGITLRARVTTTGTFANWGLARVGSNRSYITHNDALTNTANGTFWSAGNAATSAFRRGNTSTTSSSTTTGAFGVMGYFRNAVTPNNFSLAGAVNNNNGGFNAGSPSGVGGAWATGGANAFAGISGIDGGAFNSTTNTGVLALTDASVTLADGNTGGLASGGLGRAGATATDTVTSPWENVYRFLFIPRFNNSDPTRSVTVRGGFDVQLAIAFQDANGDGTGVWNKVSAGPNTTLRTAQVSFLVPAPGAAALLAIGGLAAARRRRA